MTGETPSTTTSSSRVVMGMVISSVVVGSSCDYNAFSYNSLKPAIRILTSYSPGESEGNGRHRWCCNSAHLRNNKAGDVIVTVTPGRGILPSIDYCALDGPTCPVWENPNETKKTWREKK
jgi:hypothetical protein